MTISPGRSGRQQSRIILTLLSAGFLTLASAVIIVLFARWVHSYDRVYFPAVEASRVAVFPAGSLGEG